MSANSLFVITINQVTRLFFLLLLDAMREKDDLGDFFGISVRYLNFLL